MARPPGTSDDETAPRRSLRGRTLLEPCLYLTLAIGLTWPLALHLTDSIPLGTEEVATVPLFNLWTLWWNADRLQHLYQGYWNAPIFHPLGGTFAFSEPQPLTGLFAGLVQGMTGSRVLAYNAVILLGLALNGWAACRLLLAVGLIWPAAASGGAMVEGLPFVQQELGVLQLVSLGGILATLHALVRLAEKPDLRRGLLVGLAFAATTLMCGNYGLSLSVLLLLCGGILLEGALQRRETWHALAAALIVALVMLLPVVLPQLSIAGTYRLERSASTADRFSATWTQYRQTAWPQLVPTPGIATAAQPSARAFWPGTLKVCLALVAVAVWVGRRNSRWTVFSLTVLLLALLLSFGPGDGGPSLHALFASFYPGYTQLRSPFRYAVFVQLMVAILAAGGLACLWRRLHVRPVARNVLVLALGLTAAVETRPATPHLLPLPSLQSPLPWIDWVESRTRPDDVLAFLPFPAGRGSEDYLETTQWMYWQMRHGRPMVDGYSGFFPRSFRELKAVLQDFPDARSLDLMARRGVRYCVVLRNAYPRSTLDALTTSTHRLRHVFGDDVGQVDVFEMSAIDPRDPALP